MRKVRKTVLATTVIASTKAVLPVSIIILFLAILLRVPQVDIVNFIIGDVLLVLGLSLFSIGSEASIVPIAESIGEDIVKRRRLFFFIGVAFLVGFLVTVAEPALWVLADQFKDVVTELPLVLSVSLGVGVFFVIGLLRVLTQSKLSTLFIISYILLFVFAGVVAMIHPGFIPIAFDSGGVTTGPMAVPFIISLGFGIWDFKEPQWRSRGRSG